MKKILFSIAMLTSILLSFATNAQHLVLIEEFTNASCFPCALSEPAFEATMNANTDKVISIRYHTSFPGVDPMYSHNANENQARVIYYQVTSTPQQRFEGSGYFLSDVTQDAIDKAYALPSPVNINATYRISPKSDSIYARVVVKATSTITGNLAAQIVVIEKNITYSVQPGSNGQRSFNNVMKKMLPDNNGTALPSTMNAGDSVVINVSWALANVFYVNQLAVVAFVQHTDTKAVIGTAYAPTPSGTTTPVTPPTVSLNTKTNPLCSSNGSISINVSGGTSPYQYRWSNGATSQNIAGLAAGNYTVTVSGGGASTTATYSLTQEQLAKPASLSVTDITDNTAKLNWSSVSGAAYYQVVYRIYGSSDWSNAVNTGTGLNYTFNNLTPNTTYELGVASYCINNSSAGYSYTSGTTAIASIAPSVSLGSKTNPLCTNDGNININVSGGTAPYQYNWSNGATTQNIAGLAAGNYTVTVSGGGAKSTASYLLTHEQLAQPESLTVTEVTSCSADFSWSGVSNAAYYKVVYRTYGSDIWSEPVNVGTNLRYTFNNLVPKTDYEFGVSSFCMNGNYSGYNTTTEKTLRSLSPENVTATPGRRNTVVSWSPSCYANTYWVTYRLAGTESWTKMVTRRSYVYIKSLAPGTTYEYRVKTICGEANTSVWTPVASFTTPSVTTRLEDGSNESGLAISSLSIYPNPSNGLLNIKTDVSSNSTILVRNILGQTVYHQQLSLQEGVTSFSVQLPETLSNGIYTLSILSDNERSDARFVLNK